MRLALLSAVAKLLRIQFKVDGIPYGAARSPRRVEYIHVLGRECYDPRTAADSRWIV